jgi:delta24-sterol reductase
MSNHARKVQEIASAVKSFYIRKEPYRIFHGSTNSTRPAPRDRVIDINALNSILSINTKTQTVIVEPNVPMDTLVRATLEHGLIPPVVMEFPGITVGGGFAGSAGESSSFKFGYFDQSILSVEMVLANGHIVTASKTERPDLFKGAAGSLGTLGIVTRLELQLIKAKKYVKTTYHRTHNVRETIECVQHKIDNPEHDYVDGIIFSSTHGVVITGQLTDEIPDDAVVCKFTRPWDPWYYLHVEDRTSSEGLPIKSEYIPISDYLFRYDRGGFWVGAAAFKYFGFVPFNRLTRWFLDDFMHTRMLYRALHGGKMYTQQITQDLSLPYSTAEKFIEYTAKEFGIWPLWLCPLGAVNPPTFHPTTTLPGPDNAPKSMLNIGLGVQLQQISRNLWNRTGDWKPILHSWEAERFFIPKFSIPSRSFGIFTTKMHMRI